MFKHIEKNKGFTLAEILMIAGIVALMGSIILIFSKGAIERAKIAKILQFSANINHALRAYILAEYKFEESGDDTCPNPPEPEYDDFCDTSGNGNHGRNNGGVSWGTNNEIPQIGKAGYFDGSSHIRTTASQSLISDSGLITIEAWIKPEELDGTDMAFPWIVGKLDFPWYFYLLGKKLCFGPPPLIFCSDDDVFEIEKWYHTVVTCDKTETKLFVNTKKVGSRQNVSQDGCIGDALKGLGIGYGTNLNFFKGYIDEVRIYSEALSPAQIKKLYVEGLKRHLTINNEQ